MRGTIARTGVVTRAGYPERSGIEHADHSRPVGSGACPDVVRRCRARKRAKWSPCFRESRVIVARASYITASTNPPNRPCRHRDGHLPPLCCLEPERDTRHGQLPSRAVPRRWAPSWRRCPARSAEHRVHAAHRRAWSADDLPHAGDRARRRRHDPEWQRFHQRTRSSGPGAGPSFSPTAGEPEGGTEGTVCRARVGGEPGVTHHRRSRVVIVRPQGAAGRAPRTGCSAGGTSEPSDELR